MFSIIGEVFGNLLGIGRDYLQHKREVTQARVKTKLAIEKARAESAIKIAETDQIAEINWDTVAMEQSGTSWKDEWLVILFSIPLIMAFIPGGAQIVHDGFKVLAATPEWYQVSIGVIVAASFGYRKVVDLFKRRRPGAPKQ